MPANVNITDGKTADNKGAYDIPLLKQGVVVADRFYYDFSLLNIWDSSTAHKSISGGLILKKRKKELETLVKSLALNYSKIV